MSAGFASASTRGVGCCSQTAFRNAYEGGSPRAGALKASRDANLRMLEEDMDHARQGIRGIERAFRNALNLRNDPEFHRSNYGVLVNNTLWRADYKIINVFSDGLPNHMVSGRNHPDEKYIGEAAVRDACFQIRKLRRQGVHVIGIFLGSDSELENERILYGTSFLCIRQ